MARRAGAVPGGSSRTSADCAAARFAELGFPHGALRTGLYESVPISGAEWGVTSAPLSAHITDVRHVPLCDCVCIVSRSSTAASCPGSRGCRAGGNQGRNIARRPDPLHPAAPRHGDTRAFAALNAWPSTTAPSSSCPRGRPRRRRFQLLFVSVAAEPSTHPRTVDHLAWQRAARSQIVDVGCAGE